MMGTLAVKGLILKILLILAEESSQNFNWFVKNTLSMLHRNIRSLQKNFDSFYNLLPIFKFESKVMFITESWCLDNSRNRNLYKLPNYEIIHQVRKTG